MEEDVTLEQAVQVATRMFAGLGYDVASLDLIAEALGMPTAQLVKLTGGKRELYMMALERLTRAKYDQVRAAVDAAESERDGIHRFADAYLDFLAEHPDHLAIWSHRFSSDASDLWDVEDQYLRPMLLWGGRTLGDTVPKDIGAIPLLGIVMWCATGFASSGVLAPGHGMKQADDPETLEYFRDLLHKVIDRLLLAPAPSPSS
ncbi:TetR/AcrR family transcriptional regulator [Thermomonospora umbrina]|uniref:AcrR family transcriptional regulator n=1 Tax=Thermomonospora umbrina TaxID=111806 RepID=A0A3D9SW78_9ACTN|nr:TetR/AcrR family transcriptional regulator [Thermomonospora umbrina]REE98273.1 AcrR family transcriptional regulator [Thermomonospora umbrina]